MAAFYQPPYAEIHLRLAAWLLDSLLLAILSLALFFGLYSSAEPTLWFTACVVLPTPYYLLPMLICHATLGKRLLRMRIVMQDGAPLQTDAAILRYLVFFLTAMIPFGLIASGALLFIDPERRTFHDRLAKTAVVSG